MTDNTNDAPISAADTLAWGFGRLPMMVTFFSQGFTQEHWEKAPNDDLHSAWWMLGHLAVSTDRTLPEAERVFSPETAAHFGMGKPKDESGCEAWPSPTELLERFEESTKKIAAHVKGMSAAELGETIQGPLGPCKRAEFMHFMQIHAAHHIGQISLVRRMHGLPAAI